MSETLSFRGRFLGLNTKDEPSTLPAGALQKADNVILYPSNEIQKCPGYDPQTRETPNARGVQLDGASQFFHIRDGFDLWSRTEWTLEVTYRTQSMFGSDIPEAGGLATPSATDRGQTLLVRANADPSKWGWNDSSDYQPDWILYLGGSATGPAPTFAWRDETAGTWRSIQAPPPGPDGFFINGWWHVYVRFDAAATAPVDWIEIGVREAGGPSNPVLGKAGIQTPTAAPAVRTDPEGDLLIGARWDYDLDGIHEHSNPQALYRDFFNGNIEEVRLWDSYRTDGELDSGYFRPQSGGDLQAVYTLRGPGEDTKSRVFADAEGNEKTAYLQPIDARWAASLYSKGVASLQMDGVQPGLRIPNAYLYRRSDSDTRQRYLMRDSWAASFAFHLDFRDAFFERDQVLLEFVDCGKPDLEDVEYVRHTGNPTQGFTDNALGERGIWRVWVAQDGAPGTTLWLNFGLMVRDTTGGAPVLKQQTIVHSVQLAAGATYNVVVGMTDSTTMTMYVGGAETLPGGRQVDDDGGGGSFASYELPFTEDFGGREGKKYALIVGAGIKQVRFGSTSPGDPNDIDIRVDNSTGLEGRIDGLALWSEWPTSPSIPWATLEQPINEAAARGLHPVLLSSYPMDAAAGDIIEDIAAEGNSIFFQEDPDHINTIAVLAEGTSLHGRCFGLIDHRYRVGGRGSEQRRRLILHDGGASTFNPIDHTIGTFVEGLRNDSGELVTTEKWRDSIVIATGNRPMLLWRDQLLPLSLDAPRGPITYGIVDQLRSANNVKAEKGQVGPGLRKFAFTYYDSRTGRRSPAELFVVLDLLWRKQNIVFGEADEVAQEPAELRTYHDIEDPGPGPVDGGVTTTGDDNEVGAGVDGIEPFDLGGGGFQSGSGNPHGIKAKAYLSGTIDETETNPKFKKCRLNEDNPVLSVGIDAKDVAAADIVNAFNNEPTGARCVAEELDDGIVRFRTKFVGTAAKLRIKDLPGSSAVTMTRLAMTSYNPVANARDTDDVSGVGSTEALPLPVSSRPDVSHLEIWSTVAGGNQFFLAGRVPNGTRTFKYDIPDEELGDEVLDLDAISVPSTCREVVEFEGQYIWSKDKFNPARVYISRPDEPWAIRSNAVIDFLEGDTIDVVGIEKVQGALVVFKRNSISTLVPTGDEELPFRIGSRTTDGGGFSQHGATNVRNSLIYVGDQGLLSFDGSTVNNLSQVIENQFQGVSAETISRAIVVHDRKRRQVLLFRNSGNPASSELPVSVSSNTYILDEAFVWNYDVGHGPDGQLYGFSKLTGIYVVGAWLLPDENDEQEVFLMDPTGYVHRWGSSFTYGLGELNNNNATEIASGGGARTINFSRPDADTIEYARGLTLTLVKNAGASNETRQQRFVVESTTTDPVTATVHRDWDDIPVAGDLISLGSIEADALTGRIAPLGQERVAVVREAHIELVCKHTAMAALDVGFSAFGGVTTPPQESIVQVQNTIQEQRFAPSVKKGRAVRGRWHQWRFRLLSPKSPFRLLGLAVQLDDGGDGRWGGS